MRHRNAVLALLLALLPASVSAQDAAPAPIVVQTRAALHDDFARMVFEAAAGGKLVPFTASSDGGTLSIHFAAPVAPGLDAIRRALGPYVADVALSADGTILTATLRRPVELRQVKESDGKSYLDLIDRPKAAVTAPPAAASAQAAPAPIAPPPAVAPASAAPRVAPAPAAGPPIKLAPAKSLPNVPTRVGRHDAFDRLVFDWAKPAKATTAEADGRGVVTFDRGGKFDLAKLDTALPNLKPFEASDDGTALSFTLPPGRHLRLGWDGKHPSVDVMASVPAAAPPPIPAPPPAPTPPPTPAQTAFSAADAGPVPLPPAEMTGTLGHADGPAAANGMQIRYALIEDGVSLRFEWQQPTAAAIFRRGNAVWVIFDQTQKLDFSDFHANNWPVVTAIAELPSRTGMVLRLNVWAGFNPVVRRAGTSWVVDIKSQTQRPDAPVEAQTRSEGGNTSLIYPVFQPSSPISVIDPDSGDTLVAVPLPQLGQGSDETSDYPDFRSLATAQGLLFRPIADQLLIRAKPNQVEVAAPGGLSLSSDADRQAIRPGMRDPAGLFQLADWQGAQTLSFTQRRQAFQAAIIAAPETERAKARLDLAKFYFVNGMAAETLGVLGVIDRDTPGVGEEPTVRAIRGASEEMMGLVDAAKADLGGHNLDDRPDAELWRAMIAADSGDWGGAVEEWKKGEPAFKTYPPVLRRKLAQKLGEANFRAGQKDDADALAAEVLDNDPMPGQRDLAKVLQGRIAGERGDQKKALALWAEVANSTEPDLGRAQAAYALTVTKYAQGDLPRLDAIAALDRLRFTWRGDDFEALDLRKLAELYVADNDYRSAFQTLQKIITNFPDTALAHEVAAQMQQYFTDMFLGSAADAVPPLKALAFYDEFKELTPAGAQGDAIIRKLADRLVQVDLLDRAASLLENQAKTRLTGLDQARVATQLALVRLLDHKPDDAITALDLQLSADLPADLVRQRRELRARATAEQGKPDAALKILDGDDSSDADRLRADIYWRSHNWTAVAALLQRGLTPPAPDNTIQPEAAAAVIHIATADVLGNDRAGLDQLRQRYAAAMDKTPLKDDFRLLAGNMTGGGNFRTLADKVAQLGDLQSFMSVYRQRLTQDKLSAIN
jgi:tetratricopeptide (TPR) repeat protein